MVRDGQVFWQTPSDNNNIGISTFHKWEQAFRVFSKIYTKYHPQRATKLIQYSDDIHTASLTYVWDNVYQYDKEFRLHLARHPMRSWAVILQHAWNLEMKDRIGGGYSNTGGHSHDNRNSEKYGNNGNSFSKHAKVSEPCKRYNRGKCNFGSQVHLL